MTEPIRDDMSPDDLAEVRRRAFAEMIADCKRRIAAAPKQKRVG
jgi:hypothetical protein